MKKRQSSSLDITEPSRLRFDSQQDALDYASQIVKDCNDWLASHNLNLIERYDNLEVHVVASLGIGLGVGQCDLVFGAIPLRHRDSRVSRNSLREDLHRAAKEANRCEQAVLIRIAHAVECPQKIIPSFVWLEPQKERLDIFREIYKDAIPLKIAKTISKGKLGLPGLHDARETKDGEDSLVKGGPKVDDRISGHRIPLFGERFVPDDLLRFVDSIRVRLDNTGVWLSFKEGYDPSFEINNVMLASNQALPCTSK